MIAFAPAKAIVGLVSTASPPNVPNTTGCYPCPNHSLPRKFMRNPQTIETKALPRTSNVNHKLSPLFARFYP
jgi:hypothetical protein